VQKNKTQHHATIIPTRWIGPIKIVNEKFNFATTVPLATLEKPLWPAASRGARLTRMGEGLSVVVIRENMTRSILVEADDAIYLMEIMRELSCRRNELDEVVATTSSYAKLQDWYPQIVGNLLYLRFSFTVADAAGHNMVTKAADALLDWLLKCYEKLRYVSVSGNFCVDKKVSAVNGILGRGKYVVAAMVIPKDRCIKLLRATPVAIVDLHVKKNLLGSIIAGGVFTANAHFANMLLAFYLATGQDAANIVEGSQGLVHAALRGEDLYFSVTLPNVIVGTVGSGKGLSFARDNLELLGCLGGECQLGNNARKLAMIAGACVWCGEISLLAAQTNRGELVRSHVAIERKK